MRIRWSPYRKAVAASTVLAMVLILMFPPQPHSKLREDTPASEWAWRVYTHASHMDVGMDVGILNDQVPYRDYDLAIKNVTWRLLAVALVGATAFYIAGLWAKKE
jgi:hypothetical protein